jgi:hypothetical protein
MIRWLDLVLALVWCFWIFWIWTTGRSTNATWQRDTIADLVATRASAGSYRRSPTVVEVTSNRFDGGVEVRRYAPGDADYEYWLRAAIREGELRSADERMTAAWNRAGPIGKLAILWRKWRLGPNEYMATFLPKDWFDR